MTDENLRHITYTAHTEAVEEHQRLLEKLHLDSGIRLDEINSSIEKLTLTLEEYLKVIGIP